jgi:AraC-like DNA-binding protein
MIITGPMRGPIATTTIDRIGQVTLRRQMTTICSAMMATTMTMTQISSEQHDVRGTAEGLAAERSAEATAGGHAMVMSKCINMVPWQVRCIQGHIAANLHTGIRIADLAGIARCSSYRIKRLKHNFGCTPHQYLIRRRVERAQRLLLLSDDSLRQIAAECGFVSQSHFSYLFHKIVGERPGRWRRTQAGRNS